MNKRLPKLYFILSITLSFVSGCGAPPRTGKRLHTLFPPTYNPKFSYGFSAQPASPSKFTVALISPKITVRTPGISSEPKINELLADFVKNYIQDFEKVLLNKGVKIIGPFDSLEEMTFPEKSRSDYLIVTSLELECDENEKGVGKEVPDIFERTLNVLTTITVKTELVYDLLEPLTGAKLSRHKIKSDPLSEDYNKLYYAIYLSDRSLATVNISGDVEENLTNDGFKVIMPHDPLYSKLGMEPGSTDYLAINRYHYPAYNNDLNAMGKVLDKLYPFFLRKTEELISVAEFEHLEEYKKQLEHKKVY